MIARLNFTNEIAQMKLLRIKEAHVSTRGGASHSTDHAGHGDCGYNHYNFPIVRYDPAGRLANSLARFGY